ncbi:MAG: metallophosphoesterase [Ignavibacteriae bacterium]|nr:metallophosphoesterase [Ignavibacteriota bacterium]
MRFIHTADLHLAVEAKEYSLAVLAEIGSIAIREQAAAIVFAGDVFDTFTDAYQLRGDLARWADGLPAGMDVLVLPGNHEELGRGANTLNALSFGARVRLASVLPFEIITLADTEFVLFHFRPGYLDPLHCSSHRALHLHGSRSCTGPLPAWRSLAIPRRKKTMHSSTPPMFARLSELAQLSDIFTERATSARAGS